MRKNIRTGAIVTGILLIITAAIAISLHPIAPSLRVNLTRCTNAPIGAVVANSATTAAPMPNSLSGIAIINDAEYEVVNRGNRPVDIQKGVVIEQRTKGLSGITGNIFSQTILTGSKGKLKPGDSRTFLVRFRAPSPLPFHGRGFAEWEFRAMCEAGPAELHLKFIKWLQQQTWSHYLPHALLAKEINSYTYFSAWTPVTEGQELSPSWAIVIVPAWISGADGDNRRLLRATFASFSRCPCKGYCIGDWLTFNEFRMSVPPVPHQSCFVR